MFKKKRRAAPGPNKNEEKVLREKRAHSAGLLRDVYPTVQSITVELEFFTPQHHSLDRETRVFYPSTPCSFLVPCPGRCGNGFFDLSAKLKSVIESKQAFSESKGVCMNPLLDGSKEPCGFELHCRIRLVF